MQDWVQNSQVRRSHSAHEGHRINGMCILCRYFGTTRSVVQIDSLFLRFVFHLFSNRVVDLILLSAAIPAS